MLEVAIDEFGKEVLIKHHFEFNNDEIQDIYDILDHYETLDEEVLNYYLV